MPATYHHTQQLELRHLSKGDVFKFTYDILTPPWTKRDGTPGEQTIVYPASQQYQVVSSRRIQPVDAYHATQASPQRSVIKAIGKPSTLDAGQGYLPVKAGI